MIVRTAQFVPLEADQVPVVVRSRVCVAQEADPPVEARAAAGEADALHRLHRGECGGPEPLDLESAFAHVVGGRAEAEAEPAAALDHRELRRGLLLEVGPELTRGRRPPAQALDTGDAGKRGRRATSARDRPGRFDATAVAHEGDRPAVSGPGGRAFGERVGRELGHRAPRDVEHKQVDRHAVARDEGEPAAVGRPGRGALRGR